MQSRCTSQSEQRTITLKYSIMPCTLFTHLANEKRTRRTLPQNYVTLFTFSVYGKKWRHRLHSLFSTTMHTGSSLQNSQIQDCSSEKLSKAFHTSTATIIAVCCELCARKMKNNNNIMNVNKSGTDG